MKCPECGSENNANSKFCKNCGKKLKTDKIKVENKDKKLIVALIVIAALLLSGILLYATGVIGPQMEFETKNFDGFTIDVPKDSKFVLDQSYTTDPKNIFVSYLNKGDTFYDASGIIVGTNVTKKVAAFDFELVGTDGDLTIYKNESTEITLYKVFKKGNDANIILLGGDLDALKHMANSYYDKDFKKLAATALDPSSPSTASSASSSQSMSILGGSFSTGSSLSDKTYAKIYVGPGHSGEQVTVQIWYSRDGTTLNHGNMVPAHVDSSGYISISSADAYSKYPDHATINLYDSSGSKLLDTISVNLSPTSGTQTF